MTIEELQIELDLEPESKREILIDVAGYCLNDNGFFFIDSESGLCYLFDKNGNLDDVKKIKTLYEDYINKNIKKIIIPDSVTSIDKWAFCYCCSLTSVTIPDSVISIGRNVFWNCRELTSVMIGNGVTNITGKWTFEYCTNLKSVIFKGKTMDQIKSMNDYPFGIEDESIIKCEN